MSWWSHDPRLDIILDLIADTLTQGRQIMATLSDISLAIQRQTTVEKSVVALLHQLSTQLHDAIAAEDPVAVQAVVDLIDQNTKTLSDAVFANTPLALGTATPGIPELNPAHIADTTANTQPPDAQPSDAPPPDAVPVAPDAPPPNGKKKG
jgi:hypothetical protein